jgi:uncharacterized protein (DUF2141 family)
MKRLLLLSLLVCLLLASCSTSQPKIVDNGKPGQIKVTVFVDKNGNGKLDQGESGAQDQVGISQYLSCPATHDNKITKAETDANGEVVFQNLKPGQYCVMGPGNSQTMTTKMTVEVNLSSEQTVEVIFGVMEN